MDSAETVTFGGLPGGPSLGRASLGGDLPDGGWAGRDRAAHLRADGAALARLAARPGARRLGLAAGAPLVAGPAEAPRLLRLPLAGAPEGEGLAFLGLSEEGGEGVWAEERGEAPLPEGARAEDLRALAPLLPPPEAELAATARALLGWHATHRFCARCGAASRPVQAGWQRTCPACGAHHFPRTDPVVIMLVTRRGAGGERVLLGRSPGWPEGMHSLLAGFMEPGETVEAAVRREVREEAGVEVGRVRYLASQPWPFPASLMIGCRGEALSEAIRVDPTEIESALWVSRERLLRAVSGADPELRAPRRGAIASFLLQAWLADRLD